MRVINKLQKGIPVTSILGLLALAIGYGWARYGYGLLLPNFRETFHLSLSMLGNISSLSYAAYLTGAIIVMVFVSKWGSRVLILMGIFAGSIGMILAALSNNILLFGCGSVVAGMCPGLCWSSFSDSVNDHVKPRLQKRSLAIISTGSSVGLVMITIAYILAQGNWRIIWGIGGIIGLIVLAWSWKAIPSDSSSKPKNKQSEKLERSWLWKKASVPLFIACILFGVTQATYWTYAADYVQQTFTFDYAHVIYYMITGIGGLAGLWAGDLINRFGFKLTLLTTVIFYVISIFVLFISQSWLVVCLSGFFYGITFMLYAAYLPIWSSIVFPQAPAKGFSASLIILTTGTIIGPALFGWIGSIMGYKWIFGIAALLAFSKLFLWPTNEVKQAKGFQ